MSLPEPIGEAALAFLQKLLGPVAEAGEILSDKIRFYRWKSSLKTIQRAREIVRERNLNIKEVPLRFLIPFMERASLEEEDSPLIEKWAGLLASAAEEPDRVHGVFVDILSSLSGRDVALLEEIVSHDLVTHINRALKAGFDGHTDPSTVLIHLCEAERKLCLDYFDLEIRNLVGEEGLLFEDKVRKSLSDFVDGDFVSLTVESASFWLLNLADPIEILITNNIIRRNPLSCDILLARGLLSRLESSKDVGSSSFRLRLLTPTPLAFAFASACRGGGLPSQSETG